MKVYNYSSLSSRSKPTRRRVRTRRSAPKKTHLGAFNNPFKIDFSSINSFYFQILGISLITLGIIISFQTLIDFSTPESEAGNNRQAVRIITNFQTQTKQSAIPKVSVIPPVAEAEVENDDAEVSENSVAVEPVLEAEENEALALSVYVVRSGDTLQSIAESTFGVEVEKFLAVNPTLEAPYELKVGQQLYVPNN